MSLLGDNAGMSVLKFPFKKEYVEEIFIAMYTNSFRKTKYWTGSVVFKNGNSVGEQKFVSDDELNGFSIITQEIQSFINSL